MSPKISKAAFDRLQEWIDVSVQEATYLRHVKRSGILVDAIWEVMDKVPTMCDIDWRGMNLAALELERILEAAGEVGARAPAIGGSSPEAMVRSYNARNSGFTILLVGGGWDEADTWTLLAMRSETAQAILADQEVGPLFLLARGEGGEVPPVQPVPAPALLFDAKIFRSYKKLDAEFDQRVADGLERVNTREERDDLAAGERADGAGIVAAAMARRGCLMVAKGAAEGWQWFDDAWSCHNAELFLRIKAQMANLMERDRFLRYGADRLRLALIMQIAYGFHYDDRSGQRGGLRHCHERLAKVEDRFGLSDYCRWLMDGGDLPRNRHMLEFSHRRPAPTALMQEPIDLDDPYGFLPIEQMRTLSLLGTSVDASKLAKEAKPFMMPHGIGGPFSKIAKAVIMKL